MNAQHAILAIKAIFAEYTALAEEWSLENTKAGKIYELYVLSRVVEKLTQRGFRAEFVGSHLGFKAAPGYIFQGDPHFDIYVGNASSPRFQIFTDIEFQTLGSAHTPQKDQSCYHELDIAVVDAGVDGVRPEYDAIALGVECKAVHSFDKNFLRAALGLRRELSWLQEPRPSRLADALGERAPQVPALPASELWLVFIDPKGGNYLASPSNFGVTLEWWAP